MFAQGLQDVLLKAFLFFCGSALAGFSIAQEPVFGYSTPHD